MSLMCMGNALCCVWQIPFVKLISISKPLSKKKNMDNYCVEIVLEIEI